MAIVVGHQPNIGSLGAAGYAAGFSRRRQRESEQALQFAIGQQQYRRQDERDRRDRRDRFDMARMQMDEHRHRDAQRHDQQLELQSRGHAQNLERMETQSQFEIGRMYEGMEAQKMLQDVDMRERMMAQAQLTPEGQREWADLSGKLRAIRGNRDSLRPQQYRQAMQKWLQDFDEAGIDKYVVPEPKMEDIWNKQTFVNPDDGIRYQYNPGKQLFEPLSSGGAGDMASPGKFTPKSFGDAIANREVRKEMFDAARASLLDEHHEKEDYNPSFSDILERAKEQHYELQRAIQSDEEAIRRSQHQQVESQVQQYMQGIVSRYGDQLLSGDIPDEARRELLGVVDSAAEMGVDAEAILRDVMSGGEGGTPGHVMGTPTRTMELPSDQPVNPAHQPALAALQRMGYREVEMVPDPRNIAQDIPVIRTREGETQADRDAIRARIPSNARVYFVGTDGLGVAVFGGMKEEFSYQKTPMRREGPPPRAGGSMGLGGAPVGRVLAPEAAKGEVIATANTQGHARVRASQLEFGGEYEDVEIVERRDGKFEVRGKKRQEPERPQPAGYKYFDYPARDR